MKHKLLIVPAVILVVILLYYPQWNNDEPEVHPLTKTWEIVIPHQEIPDGLNSLSAESCGECHVEHYKDWKSSTHAHAWTDKQFQAEIKKESSPFLCINCHIPLQNQQEFIITGLIDGDIYQPVKEINPQFDKALQQEGITCASCHVRNGAVIGITGRPNTAHNTVKDVEFLSEHLCISCHNANAELTPEVVCTFQTGEEWAAGPYFGVKNCVDCHMEPINRENTVGFGDTISHLHNFAGSGIPKSATHDAVGLNGLAIYNSTLKDSYNINEEIIYDLSVVNALAGHNVPTGDPERFFNFLFELKNEAGETIVSQTERIGEKWQWYPIAKKLGDNNLKPGEKRTFTFSHIPEQSQILVLSVVITKHRLAKEFAKYNKLKDDYPLFIEIFNEQYEIKVE